jgi:hypothetical protein
MRTTLYAVSLVLGLTTAGTLATLATVPAKADPYYWHHYYGWYHHDWHRYHHWSYWHHPRAYYPHRRYYSYATPYYYR